MFAHIDWHDGSNPYIATSNDTFEKLAYRNELTLTCLDPTMFDAKRRRSPVSYCDYYSKKYFWREWFIDFSHDSANFDESWAVYEDWMEFTEYIARKYGLVREFRENGLL